MAIMRRLRSALMSSGVSLRGLCSLIGLSVLPFGSVQPADIIDNTSLTFTNGKVVSDNTVRKEWRRSYRTRGR